jgi:flagellar assembly protein FliH
MFKNIPAPQGSKPASAYQRFIPREELGEFAAWNPGVVGGAAPRAESAAASAVPPAPTAAEWQARIAAARQAGYQEGYRDGLVALEGFKESFAQQATAQVGSLLDSFDEQLRALDVDISQALAASAVQLARQVLRSELQSHPELVAKVAAEAVSAVMLSARQITVHVHPLDLPLVSEGAAEALDARGARLIGSHSIARGGVQVHSDVGSVDARIAERWALAAAALGSELPLNDAPEPT